MSLQTEEYHARGRDYIADDILPDKSLGLRAPNTAGPAGPLAVDMGRSLLVPCAKRVHLRQQRRVGDILNDFSLLEQARGDAFDLVAADPKLEQPQHARMIPSLRKMFGGKLSLIDAG